MKNKRLNIVMITLAIILTAGFNSQAQRGYRGGTGYSNCLNIPDLTDKQKTQILQQQEAHRKEMAALRETWQQSANTAREKHLAEVSKKVADHRSRIRNLLNDEQKAAFDSFNIGRGRNFARANCRSAGCGMMYRGNGGFHGRFGHRWGASN
jgi:hypothetical protein